MTATLHAFPALHSFNSPRSWVLAAIVLIHLAFFWLLTAGMGRSLLIFPQPQTEVVVLPTQPKTQPPPPRVTEPVIDRSFVPPILDPVEIIDETEATPPRVVTTELPPPRTEPVAGSATERAPVEVMPEIDPRRGWSEPIYPASVIRDGIEGTVIMSLQVLENGRVGEVRVEKSSGDRRLDESAVREARRWRFVPGTRDGVPVVFWKQVPVTFRLQDRR
jgi:protein TonB